MDDTGSKWSLSALRRYFLANNMPWEKVWDGIQGMRPRTRTGTRTRGSIRIAVYRRRGVTPHLDPPPPQDQSDHCGTKGNLPLGKSGWAIFGIHFWFQPPPPPSQSFA